MSEQKVFARPASGLVRSVSAWDALIYNVVFMAPTAIFVYGIWASLLFPGADLPTTALLAIPLSIIVGLFYAIYASAMPRSGGDYVWVSRVIHPSLGFAISFFFFLDLLSIAGAYMPWFTQWGVAPILDNAGYSNAAQGVSTNNSTFIFAVFYWLISAAVISRGAKATHRVFWIFYGLTMIGIVVYVGTLLTVGQSGFKVNFDAMSGMQYDKVLDAAKAAGYSGEFSTSATMLGLAFTYINFLGFNATVYYAGEIKEVRTSQLIAIIGSILLFGFITWLLYASTYYGMGGLFVGALAYLAGTGDKAYQLPFSLPFLHFLFRYAAPNPLVYGLAVFGFSMMTLSSSLTYIFLAVRLIFAWSFDRVVPTALSRIDQRYNSPYVALILVTIVAIILQAAWIYTPLLSYFAYVVFGWMIMQGITAVSGMMFPYTRRDIFEASPALVKRRIGGIPVLVILGFLTLLISIWLAYASISPAMVGALNFSVLDFTIGQFVAGAIIYLIASAYRKAKGIPLELTFKQIPPE